MTGNPEHGGIVNGVAGTLTVTATGGGTLSYQWIKYDSSTRKWLDIAGANWPPCRSRPWRARMQASTSVGSATGRAAIYQRRRGSARSFHLQSRNNPRISLPTREPRPAGRREYGDSPPHLPMAEAGCGRSDLGRISQRPHATT